MKLIDRLKCKIRHKWKYSDSMIRSRRCIREGCTTVQIPSIYGWIRMHDEEYCSNCGAEVQLKKICEYCGSKVKPSKKAKAKLRMTLEIIRNELKNYPVELYIQTMVRKDPDQRMKQQKALVISTISIDSLFNRFDHLELVYHQDLMDGGF